MNVTVSGLGTLQVVFGVTDADPLGDIAVLGTDDHLDNGSNQAWAFFDITRDGRSYIHGRLPVGGFGLPYIVAKDYVTIGDTVFQIEVGSLTDTSVSVQFEVGVKGNYEYIVAVDGEITGNISLEVSPVEASNIIRGATLTMTNKMKQYTSQPGNGDLSCFSPEHAAEVLHAVMGYLENYYAQKPDALGSMSIGADLEAGFGVGIWDTVWDIASGSVGASVSVPLTSIGDVSVTVVKSFLDFAIESSARFQQLLSFAVAPPGNPDELVELERVTQELGGILQESAGAVLQSILSLVGETEMEVSFSIDAAGESDSDSGGGDEPDDTISLLEGSITLPLGAGAVSIFNTAPEHMIKTFDLVTTYLSLLIDAGSGIGTLREVNLEALIQHLEEVGEYLWDQADTRSRHWATRMIPLAYGMNTIPIIVVAENGTPEFYILKVTRKTVQLQEGSPSLSIDGVPVSLTKKSPNLFVGTVDPGTGGNATARVEVKPIVPGVQVEVNGEPLTDTWVEYELPRPIGQYTWVIRCNDPESDLVQEYAILLNGSGNEWSKPTVYVETLDGQPIELRDGFFAENVAVEQVKVTAEPEDEHSLVFINGRVAWWYSGGQSWSKPVTIDLVQPVTKLTVTVTSPNGMHQAPYSVELHRDEAAEYDADARSITVQLSGSLPIELYDPDDCSYTLDVESDDYWAIIYAEMERDGATVLITDPSGYNDVFDDPPPQTVLLRPGPNTFILTARAPNPYFRKVYTITINRALSSDASLLYFQVNGSQREYGLELRTTDSDGNVVPVGAPPGYDVETFEYELEYPNEITTLGVKAIPYQSVVDESTEWPASLTVNGVSTQPGTWIDISLELGLNTIDVTITAPDGVTTQTYTVKATRADVDPPVLSLPATITAEATERRDSDLVKGAYVSYTVSAYDAMDGLVNVTCTPGSSSFFEKGTTTVTCTAVDRYNNEVTGSFDVVVVDTTPPTISVPETLTVEAQDADGAWVDFSGEVAVTDLGVPVPPEGVTFSRDPGSLFPIGKTPVTCIAEDEEGNVAIKTFYINVTASQVPDTEPPTWDSASLTASRVNYTSVTLTWSAASDNQAVTSYRVYKGAQLAGTSTSREYTVTGLAEGTTYTFKVEAGDAAGNWTVDGPSLTVTTATRPVEDEDDHVPSTPGTGSIESGKTGRLVVDTLDVDVDVQYDTNAGTASTHIDDDTFKKIIEALAASSEGGGGPTMAKVAIPPVEGVTSYTFGFGSASLSSQEGDAQLVVETGIGSVGIPSDMLHGTPHETAGEVSITMGPGDKSSLPDDVKETIGDRPLISLTFEVGGERQEWSNPDAPLTVSIPYTPTPEELANPEGITVWYIDGNGNVVAVPSGRYDPETGTVTFQVTHFSHYAVVYVEKTFADLGGYEWARKAVEVLASKGIIRGTSPDYFSPGKQITRADFVVLLVRTLGLTATFEDNFSDIRPEDYYYEALGIARKLGIGGGVGDNRFDPVSYISRQDMMTLTDRALRRLGRIAGEPPLDELARFTDRDLVAPYAQDSVATLVGEGLIQGSGGALNPLSNTTRAEAAVFLYRIYNK